MKRKTKNTCITEWKGRGGEGGGPGTGKVRQSNIFLHIGTHYTSNNTFPPPPGKHSQ